MLINILVDRLLQSIIKLLLNLTVSSNLETLCLLVSLRDMHILNLLNEKQAIFAIPLQVSGEGFVIP